MGTVFVGQNICRVALLVSGSGEVGLLFLMFSESLNPSDVAVFVDG